EGNQSSTSATEQLLRKRGLVGVIRVAAEPVCDLSDNVADVANLTGRIARINAQRAERDELIGRALLSSNKVLVEPSERGRELLELDAGQLRHAGKRGKFLCAQTGGLRRLLHSVSVFQRAFDRIDAEGSGERHTDRAGRFAYDGAVGPEI